jgi:hypothetical protein
MCQLQQLCHLQGKHVKIHVIASVEICLVIVNSQ